MITQANFQENLLKAIPECRKIYSEYLEDNDDQQLLHVFMGSYLYPYFLENFKAQNKTYREILSFIDRTYPETDASMKNIYTVSFLENLYSEQFNDITQSEYKELAADLSPVVQDVLRSFQ